MASQSWTNLELRIWDPFRRVDFSHAERELGECYKTDDDALFNLEQCFQEQCKPVAPQMDFDM